MENIRNFSIIAHIDHGKSTLSDRILEISKVFTKQQMRAQMLDTMDIERERGITIKSQPIALPYTAKNGKEYLLNLVDTPGHVDFTYEVSRALAACEGALLLVDATQGVEAQTVANLYLALSCDLEIIPIINKIDLPSADIERCRDQIDKELGLLPTDAVCASGKTGEGVEDILEAIVERIPAPKGDPNGKLSALIFDAIYHAYRGVIIYCRVFEGTVKPGDKIRFMTNDHEYEVEEVGYLRIERVERDELSAGEVGYIIAGIKEIRHAKIGDTITHVDMPCDKGLPGFREVKPVVFSSFYPIASEDYPDLSDAMDRLQLNDASFHFQKDTSTALGSGFRCGFLGLLHLEITQQRLEREFNQSLVVTAPSVRYRFELTNGETIYVDNPIFYPDVTKIEKSEELIVRATIVLPAEYIGNIIKLCMERRGVQQSMHYLAPNRVELIFQIPLAEIMYDFYDQLKSRSRGYASFDYEIIGYQESDLIKVDFLVAGEPVDALGIIIHKSQAEHRGRQICKRLKESIPRQMFAVALQAAVGGKIIARETISAYRKDVLAKCYGGDISRKKKLLEKQKQGKKRMKMVGQIEIPQEAFLAVLKSGDDS
ncbi:MAG: translation elongation factor 4 [Planctomycetes bacterium]|jgi:GTP-binding protein LepA|nr:translation elongation factor 4 [Planctomycetota bacterium]HPY75327.1 translation elongation factor 4 [Planctomycetota bacterium]HQA99716.1 translation elongation factor 4 [Planctomycetota bacterium]HRU51302.1 translation elongation factor 4 [Planctomycetota bacterium]